MEATDSELTGSTNQSTSRSVIDKIELKGPDLAITVVVALAVTVLSGHWSNFVVLGIKFAVVLLLTIAIRVGTRWATGIEATFDRVGRFRYSVLVTGTFAFAVAMGLSLYAGMPIPTIHDEYSYLLAADTFAHGRLTNPPHPMWEHFETLHVLQQPTYMSKYPPAEGLVLAIGQLLWSPVLGVWLSTALAVSATFWMLKQWVPPRWALFGAIIVVFNPLMLLWSRIFMGGQLALAGGALMLGAVRKAFSSPSLFTGVLAGIGLALLANSRPYEGLVLAVATFVAFAVSFRRSSRPLSPSRLKSFAAGLSAIVVLAGLGMSFYNYRVTGSPFKLPYAVYEATYDIAPVFLWQKPNPVPAYRHADIKAFYVGPAMDNYSVQHTFSGFLHAVVLKIENYYRWHFSLSLIPLVVVGLLFGFRKSIWTKIAISIWGLFLVAVIPVETWFNPHYVAPVASLALLALILGIRRLRVIRWRRERIGLFVMRVVVATLFAFSIFAAISYAIYRRSENSRSTWFTERSRIEKTLEARGVGQLVIVRYPPDHSYLEEWVYNKADIDASPVIWARDMGDARNLELINYFKGREAWLLVPTSSSASLHRILLQPSNSN